jgi:hypothetical protein
MDVNHFDELARTFATVGSRRRFLLGLAGTAGLIGGRQVAAACPPGQVDRRGIGCVCRASGRPPVDGVCPCPRGQTDTGDGQGCLACRSTDECPPSDACVSYACVDGACAATKTVCDDGDPCTANRCDPAVGCVYPPLSDGQPGECTGGQVCCGEVCTRLGSVTNCASCGHACSAPAHASATCVSSACRFDCHAGYTACNSVCEAVPPIPDTILGGQIAWLLAQFNSGANTLTEEEFYQHFDIELDFEIILEFFKDNLSTAPFEFAGFVGTPTDFEGTYRLVVFHHWTVTGVIRLESTAPHRIIFWDFRHFTACP